MDKTMEDKLIDIPNDDTQNFCSLQLVVETFGHLTKLTNLKFNKSPQSG